NADELRRHLLMIDFDVVRHVALGALHGFENNGELLRFRAHLNHITLAHTIARHVDTLAIHKHMAVAHELAGGENGRHELGAVNDRIETTLEQADQKLARVTTTAVRILVDATELLFRNIAIKALELLLGAELHAIVRELAL